MSGRSRILNRLAIEDLVPYPEIGDFTHPVALDLWQEFKNQLEALGGRFGGPDILAELASRLVWIEPAAEGALETLPGVRHNDVWTADFVLTIADFAVASTGSIVVSAGPRRSRLASLVPPVHVALVRAGNIVGGLHEAFARGISDRTSAIITGPSRTADIEGVLVRGIHGPKELWVVKTG